MSNLSKVMVLDYPNQEEMFEGVLPLTESQMRELRTKIADKDSYNFNPKTGFVTVREGALKAINEYLYDVRYAESQQ